MCFGSFHESQEKWFTKWNDYSKTEMWTVKANTRRLSLGDSIAPYLGTAFLIATIRRVLTISDERFNWVMWLAFRKRHSHGVSWRHEGIRKGGWGWNTDIEWDRRSDKKVNNNMILIIDLYNESFTREFHAYQMTIIRMMTDANELIAVFATSRAVKYSTIHGWTFPIVQVTKYSFTTNRATFVHKQVPKQWL